MLVPLVSRKQSRWVDCSGAWGKVLPKLQLFVLLGALSALLQLGKQSHNEIKGL